MVLSTVSWLKRGGKESWTGKTGETVWLNAPKGKWAGEKMTETISLSLCLAGSKNLPSAHGKNPFVSRTDPVPNKVVLESRNCLFTSFIPSKNIPWLFTEKSGHQKRSGIQLKIIINSPVWLRHGSPFPSLLSHPITSFSLVVPQKTLLLPTTALVPFPLSSLGTFPPLPRPS